MYFMDRLSFVSARYRPIVVCAGFVLEIHKQHKERRDETREIQFMHST